MKKGTLTERGDKTDETVYSAPPLGDPGGGGGHSDPDGPACGVGRVSAAGDGRVQPDRGRRWLCVRHPDRSVRGGMRHRWFFAGQKRPALRGAVGHRPALWRVLCGGPPARGEGRMVLGSVQHSGGAGHGVSLPVHPVLRPEVVRRAQGPCHGGHWRRGGPERCVPDRIRPHGAEGLWPGAGNPGGVLGAGGTHAAGLPSGQRPAHRPAPGKAEARGAGQGKRQPTAALAAGAEPAKAAAAVVDKDSTVELYAGFGKSVYTAFATVGGNAVGVVATGKNLCHNCVAKIARFVRLCDAFSVPVVTVVDTEGFVPSVSDDIAGGVHYFVRWYVAATLVLRAAEDSMYTMLIVQRHQLMLSNSAK